MSDTIEVINASTHNLKNISLSIPRNKLVVFTGVSGSGKSSLVFDTIYAEAQRRYLETLSSYGQSYLNPLEKAPVEKITGLSPAIAIDQKSASNSPRSTVGTITEVTDYLRLLFAKVGTPHCPKDGTKIEAQSLQQMLERIKALPQGTRLQLLAPVVRGRKGDYNALFQQLRKEGFQRVRADGEFLVLDEMPEDFRLARYKEHTIEVVIDRLILKTSDSQTQRLSKALEQALRKGDGQLVVLHQEKGEDAAKEFVLSQHLACNTCGTNYGEMAPRLFSFNSPYGACETCQGTGLYYQLRWDKCVPDPSLSLLEDGIPPLAKVLGRKKKWFYGALAKQLDVDARAPLSTWNEKAIQQLLKGKGAKDGKSSQYDWENDDSFSEWLLSAFPGLEEALFQRWQHAKNPGQRKYLTNFFEEKVCPACEGARLNPFALAVRLADLSFDGLHNLSVSACYQALIGASHLLNETTYIIARQPLQEALSRLRFLEEVGLSYLSLGRRANTLSGGEAQRIRLASQLGSNLSGVLYVLDEPSIGLHPQNTEQLIKTLKHLCARQNSLLIVEHEEQIIEQADYLIDIGPYAGLNGGELVLEGPVDELKTSSLQNGKGKHSGQSSLTQQYLSHTKQVSAPEARREGTGKALKLVGAKAHNLDNLTVEFPLGTLMCVTGPSGSGKSTLVFDCIEKALSHYLTPEQTPNFPETVKALKGYEAVTRVLSLDQSPIGKSSRSNIATYTNLFDTIRLIFTGTEQAKILGLNKSAFSFNVKGGRCESCQGTGKETLQMGLLPKVEQTCPYCQGQRFQPHVLSVTYQGLNITQVLNLSIRQSLDFFGENPKLVESLSLLNEIGLGYLKLGQATSTLSGGEAERLKLSVELNKKQRGHTLYLMDEPSIGLHWQDIQRLVDILHKLVDQGHTVVLIEHNIDLIKNADIVYDLGPGGGDYGGKLTALGTPESLRTNKLSPTGPYL